MIDLRGFYEHLYQEKFQRNAAHEIYDRLRVKCIRELAMPYSEPILIVGCGSQHDFDILPKTLKIIAFDISLNALLKAPRDRLVFVGNALKIPIESEKFNLIICSEVLEHIPDIRSAVRELRRVIKPGGILIVSSPNWHSWFGLARWIGEKFTRQPIHSSSQPYDDWKTWKRYKEELSPEFKVIASRGVWYLPPLHYRTLGIPRVLMNLLYYTYAPLETLFSRMCPHWGHILILKCQAK
ncbi:MAG: methyltransferase domain-containing protein [Candidatus Methanomethyliaceae archaeon]